jgi:hypothetical protein
MGQEYWRGSESGFDAGVTRSGELVSGSQLSLAEQAGANFGSQATASTAGKIPSFDAALSESSRVRMQAYRSATLAKDADATAVATGTYFLTTIYMQAIPRLVGVNDVAAQKLPDRPTVFKILALNGVIPVSVAIEQDYHGWIPVAMTRLMDDGSAYNLHSYQERSEKYQVLGSMLVQKEMAALDRVIQDRAIYDPELIDPRSLIKAKSTGKIPLKASTGLASRDIGKAYYQIPYNNTSQGVLLQNALALGQISNNLLGQNAVGQGQFIPGNKTNEQFQATLQGAGVRSYPLKIVLADNFFWPIKFMLKCMLLQYRNVKNMTRFVGEQVQEIPPDQVKATLFELQLGDGLESPERLARDAEFRRALQDYASTGLLQELKVPELLAHLHTSAYAKNITKFRYTPEELAQRAQAQAAAAAQQPTGQRAATGNAGLPGA